VFPRQRGKKIYVGLGFGEYFYRHPLFTLTNTVIRTYNFFGRFLFNVIHSRTANLGEVSSAQLSLALVEAKLTGHQVQVQVTLQLTVSQSVSLGVELHLELMTKYLLLFASYGLVFLWRPL
jgi:hypothetical protein